MYWIKTAGETAPSRSPSRPRDVSTTSIIVKPLALKMLISGHTAQVKHTANVRKILTSQKNFANHLDDFLALQALEANNAAAAAASKRAATAKKDEPTPVPVEKTYNLLVEPFLPQPVAHPGDNEALLRSRVPPLPTDAELRALLAQPALTYGEAKGRYDEYGEGSYPRRVFCEVCGYWGRVRCMKCGTRVCALQCLDLHREECVTRYGL